MRFNHSRAVSGQIQIEPDLWRRAERNRTGDRFTFEVRRSVLSEIDFRGEDEERWTVRIAEGLDQRRTSFATRSTRRRRNKDRVLSGLPAAFDTKTLIGFSQKNSEIFPARDQTCPTPIGYYPYQARKILRLWIKCQPFGCGRSTLSVLFMRSPIECITSKM